MRLFHVIPSLTVGGIQSMLVRVLVSCPTEIDYHLVVLSEFKVSDIPIPEIYRDKVHYMGNQNSPITFFKAAIMLAKANTKVIASSTWRASIVVGILNLFGCRPFHVAFTHRSSKAHYIDSCLREWQVTTADLNIADSAAAAEWINIRCKSKPTITIPPIFQVQNETRSPKKGMKICFIGRLAPVKNLETIFKIIGKLVEQNVSVSFHVYGPDEGCLKQVDDWIKIYNKDPQIRTVDLDYRGAIQPNNVHKTAKEYHFIISCSHTEGFAMSIAEAMQVGVVPIVGLIGGPKTYCNPDNSIMLKDYSDDTINETVEKVLCLWRDPIKYQLMSVNAEKAFGSEYTFTNLYSKIIKDVFKSVETKDSDNL